MVNPKWYTGIDQYQNISFRWLNRYSLRYEIDFLGLSTTHPAFARRNWHANMSFKEGTDLETYSTSCSVVTVWIKGFGFSTFLFWLWLLIWMPYWTLLDLILVALERYGCLVSETLELLKIRLSDQMLWSQEASWCDQNSFQDISTSLTPILTYE